MCGCSSMVFPLCPVETQNNPVLVANKGTLKRKGQLRDIVTMIDKDYSDDILESTPMRENRFQLPVSTSHVYIVIRTHIVHMYVCMYLVHV